MLTYQRLRNLAVLVNAVAFFTAVVLVTRIKLAILATHLVTAAKRLFGIPDCRLYALADGIREICARSPRRPQPAANAPAHPRLPLKFVGKVLARSELTGPVTNVIGTVNAAFLEQAVDVGF